MSNVSVEYTAVRGRSRLALSGVREHEMGSTGDNLEQPTGITF